jgi:glycine dehydrogenase subunit 1
MPFIPHRTDELNSMLESLNITAIKELFDEIPADIPAADLSSIGDGLSELEITRLMEQREPKRLACYLGAGAYEHHTPAAVWDIISRGEFYTAYTPYQAEASQGSLSVIFEYQSMISELLSMEVSNASLYDGGSALAEAALMAIRLKRGKVSKIVCASHLHPAYRQVLNTILTQQNIELITINITATGQLDQPAWEQQLQGAAAVIISQPTFFGTLEDVDQLTDLAHQHQVLVIAQVNPLACAWLKPPGQWGQAGADIACGEGQSLGLPLMSGGPYFGFMATRKAFIRQLPGRIVGKTVDKQQREGFTLTLQAREQHIRRGKATSNICTNQGLMVVAATVYMRLLGGDGLQAKALQCHTHATQLASLLTAIPGITLKYPGAFFHEFIIELENAQVSDVLEQLAQQNIQGGYNLSAVINDLQNCLLVCVTETKIAADLEHYANTLSQILSRSTIA